MASETLYTLKIRNGGPSVGTVIDMKEMFGFVCLEGATYPAVDKYKELSKTSWYDEHGDDVYHPKKRYKESMTIEIPVGCEGSRAAGGTTVKKRYDALEDFLSTGFIDNVDAGLSKDGLSIYMPLEQRGYSGCDLVEIKEKEYQKRGDYEIFTCTLVFNISDPSKTWDGK